MSKTPKGDQAYKGNGKHDWEKVTGETQRLRVPCGWIYRDINYGWLFVPMAEVVGYRI